MHCSVSIILEFLSSLLKSALRVYAVTISCRHNPVTFIVKVRLAKAAWLQKHHNKPWRINSTTTWEKIESKDTTQSTELKADRKENVLEWLYENKDHNSTENVLLDLQNAFQAWHLSNLTQLQLFVQEEWRESVFQTYTNMYFMRYIFIDVRLSTWKDCFCLPTKLPASLDRGFDKCHMKD